MEKDLKKVTKYDKIIEASTWLIIVALIFSIQFLPNKLLGGGQSFVIVSAIICFALIYYSIIYRYFSKSSRVYLKNIADIILIGVLIFSMKDYGQYFFALYFIPIAAAALSLEFANALLVAVIACLFVILEMILGSQGYYPESMRVYQGVWQIGLILFITVFCRFLANQIRQERTLKEESEAREKIMKEEAEKEKEFISLTSHQLYTPISIIRGFSSMLTNESLGKLTEKQYDAASKIYNNSKRMVNLVTELLAVSNIQTKSFKINPTKTDVKKMAQEVVNEINQTKKKDSVELKTEFGTLKPTELDGEKIRQVLANLISNAIKYTRQGKIVLKIDQNAEKTNFILTDIGAGIRDEDKEKIFQPFFRGKNILELDNKGTGLGLYISRMIVDAHGGEINFISKEGKGSTFYFSIPRKERMMTKVLIIDDEQELLKMYEQVFSNAGFTPILAENGEVGIKTAKDQKPDVILLDIIMPKMNGLDVLEALKKDPDIKEIPVILLTNLPQECSGEKAKELGAAGYLVKAEKEPAQVVEYVKQIVQK